jgi:hypothetical protein
MQAQLIVEKYKTVFKNDGILKLRDDNLDNQKSLRVCGGNEDDTFYYLTEQTKTTCTA